MKKIKSQKINSVNKKFDPNYHQAMLEIEDDKTEPGVIIQEIQPGYMFGDRLLRPSFVGVSKKKKDKNGEKSTKNEKNRLVDAKKTPIYAMKGTLNE